MYRQSSSLNHSEFKLVEQAPAPALKMSPNSYLWPAFPANEGEDWIKQGLVARNGDPGGKYGVAIWMFAVTKDMVARAAHSSLDGSCLIVPQSGAIDIQTELGRSPLSISNRG